MSHLQVEVRQRGQKRRLGLRASKKPKKTVEDKFEAPSGADPSEFRSDAICPGGVSQGWPTERTEQQAQAPSCTDALGRPHSSGASVGGSENSEVTRVKSKPAVIEASSNLLLGEEIVKNDKKNRESEEPKESGKSDLLKAKLRRLDDPSELVDQPEGKEKGGVSSLTRKRLAEFRAPEQGAEMPSEVVMNNVEKGVKNTDHGDAIGKAVKKESKVQKKSSSGNLLSFVTKMKFDTTKLMMDGDPFKQDDFDLDWD